MWPNPQFPADWVTFTEKTLNGKLHFLCSEASVTTSVDQSTGSYQEKFRWYAD